MAQEKEFKKENFPGKESQFNKIYQAYLRGNMLFSEGEGSYLLAKVEYEKAYAFNPANSLLNYNLGICYLKSPSKYKAKNLFINALQLNSRVDQKINYYLGICYQLESKWDSALFFYDAYEKKLDSLAKSTDWQLTEKRKEECRNGAQLSLSPVPVIIKNLGPKINTKYAEYTPFVSTDESMLFFTSRRSITNDKISDVNDGLYYEDIYLSSRINNEWQPAVNAGNNINSKWDDAICGIFPDGHTMITFRGDVNEGDLYIVKYMNGIWSKPVAFGPNINSPFHESSACLSSNSKQLFFVSTKPGGFGGRDIYVSNWNAGKNEWGEAVNLGHAINTKFDEEGVFLHPDNKTLYFASNGPLSIGGYDILKSEKKGDRWSSPVNLGIPVNTPDDDVFVSVSGNGINIYFSSNKKDSYGDQDIYVANLEKTQAHSPNMFVLTGEVVDEITGKPIDARIELIDLAKNEKIGSYTVDKNTGKYIIPLPGGIKYGTVVYADGYIFESENVEVNDTATFSEIKHAIHLKKIESGTVTRLNNIFFESGRATILPTSINELDRIANFLKKDMLIKIEICGYTDNVGDAAMNLKLSTQRAEEVFKELLDRDIQPLRITFIGKGEASPSASNATEEGRRLNRRIEFKILEK